MQDKGTNLQMNFGRCRVFVNIFEVHIFVLFINTDVRCSDKNELYEGRQENFRELLK